MPGPDPNGLHLEEYEDGSWSLTAAVWYYGNRRARIARMMAVSRRMRFDGWKCSWCRDPVPLYRRADARFCGESCRKKAARWRRRARWGGAKVWNQETRKSAGTAGLLNRDKMRLSGWSMCGPGLQQTLHERSFQRSTRARARRWRKGGTP